MYRSLHDIDHHITSLHLVPRWTGDGPARIVDTMGTLHHNRRVLCFGEVEHSCIDVCYVDQERKFGIQGILDK